MQGCLVEGLARTTAGLGSVIIDSQPLTVAILAAVLYGELLGPKSVVALAAGVFGLVLIEVPVAHLLRHAESTPPPNANERWSVWDSGEWWMLLAAQAFAVGTVMMRWVSKFSDPLMVIGWVRKPCLLLGACLYGECTRISILFKSWVVKEGDVELVILWSSDHRHETRGFVGLLIPSLWCIFASTWCWGVSLF